MLRATMISLCVLATAATASANATFYNATAETLTVEATFPNGKVEKRQLRDGSEVNSSQYFLAPPGVAQLAVRIYNDVGTELWKGTSGPDDVFVAVPDGKSIKTVHAGVYGGGFDTPKAALFMNITGEAITLDLEGMNGVGSHRGIKPGAGFDLKQLVRLDPKESYFSALVKGGKGGDIAIKSTKVTPGHYYLVMKNSHDTYRLLSLGYLAPPVRKK